LEGGIHILIEVTPRHLPGVSEENHQKPLSGWLMAQSIFKPHISCIQMYGISATAAYSINMCNSIFGVSCKMTPPFFSLLPMFLILFCLS